MTKWENNQAKKQLEHYTPKRKVYEIIFDNEIIEKLKEEYDRIHKTN